jgi:hypothetical protein
VTVFVRVPEYYRALIGPCRLDFVVSINHFTHETESPHHYTSSTLIGGKGGASSSLLHTSLEGPAEYVNVRWMSSLHGFLHGIKWIEFHGHLDYFQKPPLEVGLTQQPGDHGTLNAHNRWFILFYHVWGPAWIKIDWNSIWLRVWLHMTSHHTWGSVTTLHDCGGVWDGLLTLSFGLSRFHGHSSWLVCEVTLRLSPRIQEMTVEMCAPDSPNSIVWR